VYARLRVIQLKGRRVVRMARVRGFVRGRYSLRATGLSQLGRRVAVRTNLRGSLRK
jgi:hypothetical protein